MNTEVAKIRKKNVQDLPVYRKMSALVRWYILGILQKIWCSFQYGLMARSTCQSFITTSEIDAMDSVAMHPSCIVRADVDLNECSYAA